jgi:threonylcarbamoyladenosine tRNA methylthiotransferase MtaB
MNTKKDVRFVALGCRLNTLEAEKIARMLQNASARDTIIVNTCSVTAEAERQSKQTVRKLIRENPTSKIFATGCAVTRDVKEYTAIPGVAGAVANDRKLDSTAYGFKECDCPPLDSFSGLTKGLVQIQNGCNHSCAYCIVSKLRGKSVSFSYEKILTDVHALVNSGYAEIVLTGVDIAGFQDDDGGLSNLLRKLLSDVPDLKRLRLSSLDPAVRDLKNIIELIRQDSRLLPHIHLSMQSGCDEILRRMGRRHNIAMMRDLMSNAPEVSFSWDLICGFPGESEEYSQQTCDLIRELKPIRLHAFPFSARPGTAAAEMPGQVARGESKKRVAKAVAVARENMLQFMRDKIGGIAQVLVEENGVGRTVDDIPIITDSTPGDVLEVKITSVCEEKMIFN